MVQSVKRISKQPGPWVSDIPSSASFGRPVSLLLLLLLLDFFFGGGGGGDAHYSSTFSLFLFVLLNPLALRQFGTK